MSGPDWERLRSVPLGKAAPEGAPGDGLADAVRHYWLLRGILAVRQDRVPPATLGDGETPGVPYGERGRSDRPTRLPA